MAATPPAAPAEGPTQEDVQEALHVGEQVRAQLEAIEAQRAYLGDLLSEYGTSRRTLEALRSVGEGDEVLLPVGGGNFVPARVTEPGKVLMALGSGVHAESGVDKALERMADRIQNLEQAMKRLSDEANRLSREMERINGLLQQVAGGGR